MAVETIVVSMAASIMVSIRATSIQFLFNGKESSIVRKGTCSEHNEFTVFCNLPGVFLDPSARLFPVSSIGFAKSLTEIAFLSPDHISVYNEDEQNDEYKAPAISNQKSKSCIEQQQG